MAGGGSAGFAIVLFAPALNRRVTAPNLVAASPSAPASFLWMVSAYRGASMASADAWLASSVTASAMNPNVSRTVTMTDGSRDKPALPSAITTGDRTKDTITANTMGMSNVLPDGKRAHDRRRADNPQQALQCAGIGWRDGHGWGPFDVGVNERRELVCHTPTVCKLTAVRRWTRNCDA